MMKRPQKHENHVELWRQRRPSTPSGYSFPEISGAFRDFDINIETDPETEIPYSRGYEWHNGISSETNGELPNCYYMVNSDGRHWYEYVPTPDVVTLGCSITAGMGLPVEYTWPSIYAQATGKNVNNIARPGASMVTMVYRFFHHIAHYGMPKHVIVYLSDPYRYWRQSPSKGTGFTSDQVLFYNEFGNYYMGQDGSPFYYTEQDGNPVTLHPDIVLAEHVRTFEMMMYACQTNNTVVEILTPSSQIFSDLKRFGWHVKFTREQDYDYSPTDRDQELFWEFGFDFKDGNPHYAHTGLREHLGIASTAIGDHIHLNVQSDITCWASPHFDHDAPKFVPPN